VRLSRYTKAAKSVDARARSIPECSTLYYVYSRAFRRNLMANRKLADGTADAIAAVIIVTVAVLGLALWLGGMPT